MKFTTTGPFGDTVEILYNDHYVASRKVIDLSGIESGAVKAGTPIGTDGKPAVTADGKSNAIGILLHDVNEDNPNGTIVVHGFIDTAKAQTNSGVTVDDATKAALPLILFC